ncbi:MAG TPA: hypothetical protein VKG92_05790, partial [Flavobacteriales bacterium]|nr:hypothetical protein [Flavobacteriales bacterium]
MLRRTFAPLSILFFASLLSAQAVSFSGGSMSIAAGTNVVLNGPLVWQLSADAVVVNDGLIELGEQAQLEESAGAPITGTGTEHALLPLTGPLVAAEPGGLGLTLSSALSEGTVSVTRGHLPRTATNGAVGIGRWFAVGADPATNGTLDLALY